MTPDQKAAYKTLWGDRECLRPTSWLRTAEDTFDKPATAVGRQAGRDFYMVLSEVLGAWG